MVIFNPLEVSGSRLWVQHLAHCNSMLHSWTGFTDLNCIVGTSAKL